MKYLNALNKIEGIGSQKMRTLLGFFGNSETAWQASSASLEECGIGPFAAEKIISQRKDINPDVEWEKLEKEKIRLLVWGSQEYPRLLAEIPRPPYIIYMRGEFDFNSTPLISVVGSRKYTPYGLQATENLTRELALAGITVVSGMAIGIDSFAHRAALGANGKTIAVLAGSLDDEHLYPRINFNLSREIIENGALISEYPLFTESLPELFPARNRLIAGLTLGTLVVEAAENSGSLITANLALEFNREVFAVPGSIFSPQSLGTNSLIKKGAKTVASVKDILEELNLQETAEKSSAAPRIPATPEEKILLEILSSSPLHIDNISKLSKLGTATALSTLSLLEIKGWAKNIGGQNYIST
jgi:DNA processing protein